MTFSPTQVGDVFVALTSSSCSNSAILSLNCHKDYSFSQLASDAGSPFHLTKYLVYLDVEEDKEEEEGESEYSTDSEDEHGGMMMLKPVFVPKAERDTIAERERIEAEELALEEARKKKLEERKRETKQIVVEEIRKDEEIQKGMEQDANIADIDTDDELNEAEEYESWKAREIARIKRDREEREAMLKEKEEIERSDADDHAATVGTDGIFTRDFSAPTGEDKMDKTILPKVMQVKHFGRSGRTKWTHLVNEDTTDWNNP
ncbi:hypothetical protein ACLB2K_077380 [Fragaria x ananassa]